MRLRHLATAALAASFWSVSIARAEAPDWAALAAVERVEIATTDADGDPRETTIWFAVHEGVAYIRTSGGSRWGDDVERDPDVVLRIDGQEHPLRATRVSDEALLEGIHATFHEKYGWFDSVAGVIRGRNPRIMQLAPRE